MNAGRTTSRMMMTARPDTARGTAVMLALLVPLLAFAPGAPPANAGDPGTPPIDIRTMPAADADMTGRQWILSLGGKLYDNHWAVLGIDPPKGRNPVYPAGAAVPAPDTWRCVACHGWDYRGREGHLKKLANSPRFVSLRHLRGKPAGEITAAILGKPHGRVARVLPPPMLNALALFISRGQHDVARMIDARGRARGNSRRGKDIYEGTCISCHQADGKAWIQGEEGDRPALGWVARHRPEQALHKIRNGVPGADMLSLRFLPLSDIAAVLAYLQTLDPKVTPPEERVYRP
ncbi:MAG TPA: hypothetical protein ENK13_01710 [Thermopetrobacter sp.]|nr:hypothetical protein [Thermopetrobacter sp.]